MFQATQFHFLNTVNSNGFFNKNLTVILVSYTKFSEWQEMTGNHLRQVQRTTANTHRLINILADTNHVLVHLQGYFALPEVTICGL